MTDFSISNNWHDFKEPMTALTWVRSGVRSYISPERINWHISWNNFPDEPMYTLYIDHKVVLHFDDFPVEWTRIDKPA
jgi:hypothetical protein